jgi:hypothetical protein
MKAKELETELTENGINSRVSHKYFVEHVAKTSLDKPKKMVRHVDKSNYSMLAMLGIEDFTTRSKISVHPEFMAYAFHLYGLSRKLFLYLVFCEVNNDTCRFTIDDKMIERFRGFCLMFNEEENTTTILQATRSLIRKNILLAISDTEYMLNPLIAGGANENKRRKLIDSYGELLQKKGLDTSVHFYPKYGVVL